MKETNAAHQHGYTVVELAVVSGIVGLLAAIAIPTFQGSRDNARIVTLENDLRLYEQTFNTFKLDNGDYPSSVSSAGVIPSGLEGDMSAAWKLPSPIGGTYRWVYSIADEPEDSVGYIEIVHSSLYPIIIDQSRLQTIDEQIDNGDPDSGSFRIHGENLRYYLSL
ncbi:prepilin-type N-terminal cleavage/methylation domain-containing protein [Coraliomargarita sp. SDUM461004]|uniref:Prepilin-type N-terminal cleavage/methylation domain-containing protein n=1 Tax=Thalassobacterium sedimentorum TaxID=3041258 RepID=A0ABU1AID5_9BACT|nr:prepilin-type N-terminal cleavage/methylation domain-containing protein [Coraliomargarita sp. SDUM461004]MDQ8194577.1 prepilin-type N-terminal cleavage/methylation domain-containing protein [Coraliomargarita sp. SDUM461004]